MIQLQHNLSALTLLLDDLNDTGMLGQKIASVLSPGMTILLEGELGAEKRRWCVRFAARSAGNARAALRLRSSMNTHGRGFLLRMLTYIASSTPIPAILDSTNISTTAGSFLLNGRIVWTIRIFRMFGVVRSHMATVSPV